MTGINVRAIISRVASVPYALGHFDTVTTYEPKSAPGSGLHCAVWMEAFTPLGAASGLAATSFRMELTVRIYKPFLEIPADLIDPLMAESALAIIAALSGDFEVGGEVRNIDLLGAHGQPLEARAGYQSIDKTVFRVMDITVPMIINDVADQVG